MANIRIFDPACGSGNFLIIAYKQLRLLEIKIITQLKNLYNNTEKITGFEEKQTVLFKKPQLSLADVKPKTALQIELFSRIELNHFYGIELDDFAHEIAKLSLWLAQHQMNMEFNSLLGATNPSLPLSDAGQITQGNATRLNWETVCPKPKVGEVFILGNPPYLGYSVQTNDQKEDMAIVFRNFNEYKSLDFIASWFYKAKKYIENSKSYFAFVTTNSLVQGEQVYILWEELLRNDIEIFFAHTSFKWGNNAKHNAGVSVVIIGIRNKETKPKYIIQKGLKKSVENINAYLNSGRNIYIKPRQALLSNLPKIGYGSSALDDGNLMFSEEEKNIILKEFPSLKIYFLKAIGSQELIKGLTRWCIWANTHEDAEILSQCIEIKKRFENVKKFRLLSKREGTIKASQTSYRFAECRFVSGNSIIIPKVSSELRDYIPIGFANNVVILDKAFPIYNSSTFLFSILSSKMHLSWLNTVGGKLETRLSYSSSIVYNNFPFPPITQAQKDELEQHTHNILKARANHTQKTLAEMYDPNKMPDDLRQVHQANDKAIEKCYRDKPFTSDEERLAYLFNLYETMIEAEKTKGTLFALEPKAKVIKKAKKK